MELAEEVPLALVWHPFLLNPNLPSMGVPRRDYVLRRYGSVHAADPPQRRARAAAAEAGLEINPERQEREPSTLLAHAMLLGAGARMTELARALFEAFFRDGRDIGDLAVLRSLACPFGLGPDAAGTSIPAVAAMHDAACRAGIEGVPLLVFGHDHVIAGSQPVTAMRALLALERYRLGLTPADAPHGRQAS
jgi:predicted DsbA family dithiol-disulfide isomerase